MPTDSPKKTRSLKQLTQLLGSTFLAFSLLLVFFVGIFYGVGNEVEHAKRMLGRQENELEILLPLLEEQATDSSLWKPFYTAFSRENVAFREQLKRPSFRALSNIPGFRWQRAASEYSSYADSLGVLIQELHTASSVEKRQKARRAISLLLEQHSVVLQELAISAQRMRFLLWASLFLLLGWLLFVALAVYFFLKHEALIPLSTLALQKPVKEKERLRPEFQEIRERIVRQEALKKELFQSLTFSENGHITQLKEELPPSVVREIEDRQQAVLRSEELERLAKWTSYGLSKFAERLGNWESREDYIEKQFLIELANYTDVGILSFLLYEEEAACFKPLGLYAWEQIRQTTRTLSTEIPVIEELVCSQECYYTEELPESYPHLTPDHKEQPLPTTLLLLPLIAENQVQGILEIFDFKKLKPHEIDFFELLAKLLSTVIAGRQVRNLATNMLSNTEQLYARMQDTERSLMEKTSALHELQQESRAKELELQGLFNSIDGSIGMLELDQEGKIMRANVEICKTLGYKSGMLEGRNLRLLVDNTFARSQSFYQVSSHLRAGVAQHLSMPCVTRFGKERWIYFDLTPVLNTKKEVTKIIAFARDITEEKISSTENKLFSSIINTTAAGILVTDAEQRTIFANRGVEQITGFTKEELYGKKPGHLLQGPQTSPETLNYLREQIALENNFYVEIINYTREGTPYWIALLINPIFDEENRLQHFVAVQTNISETVERKLKAEERIKKLGERYFLAEYDPTGKLRSVGKKFAKHLKEEAQALQGLHFKDLLATNKQNPSFTEILTVFEKEDFARVNLQRQNSEGKPVYTQGYFVPVYDTRGDLERIWEVSANHKAFITLEKKYTDLQGTLSEAKKQLNTYRQEAERWQTQASTLLAQQKNQNAVLARELEEQQSLLKALFVNLSSAVMLVTEEGRILEASTAARKTLRWLAPDKESSILLQHYLQFEVIKSEGEPTTFYLPKIDKKIHVNAPALQANFQRRKESATLQLQVSSLKEGHTKFKDCYLWTISQA